MKRKITAIMAADIVGYSKLVSDDEEETIRRMSSYRSVFEDFVARYFGRIFNTAGDAFLAEFPSAVDAVRCAIDVQESLRTRNLAYPVSRQMCFRIGITVGDVIERDGDLLGDGVNIAARLEGLAQPGGICVSSIVYGQVANKLSVPFADMGEQQLKNIAEPIHAYALGLDPNQVRVAALSQKKPVPLVARSWPVVLLSGCVAVFASLGIIYLFVGRPSGPATAPTERPSVATAEPKPAAEPLMPENIPFISDSERAAIRANYLDAPDHKAIAISTISGYITGQKDIETAKVAALEACKRIKSSLTCQLYAVNNEVVFKVRPPMPPHPWITRDSSIEAPFSLEAIPLVNDNDRTWLGRNYVVNKPSKALALGARGTIWATWSQPNVEPAARRSLELCGFRAGAPCMIVAVDDVFVVPVPRTMHAVGFFRAASATNIAPEFRDDVARRIGSAGTGWNAIAVGAGGTPGLGLGAATEKEAVDQALTNCGRNDRSCRVIAIGPFTVEPIDPTKARPLPAPPYAADKTLVPEAIPFIADSEQAIIRTDYLAAPDYKAIAISYVSRFITGQSDEESAKTAALEACKRATPNRPCRLYAVGNTIVFTGGRPPMPAEPFFVRNATIEQPYDPKMFPAFARDREWTEKNYATGRKAKAIAISPRGTIRTYVNQSSTEEAVRRALQECGDLSGIPCIILAVDDVFVVPIPTSMKVIGLFRAAAAAIANDSRDEVARQLTGAAPGWNAVAVGTRGRPGLKLKADTEGDAIAAAHAECAKQDDGCHIIAIGPFAVAPL